MNKKVFVSGCFDLIHSGHIEFLKSASEFGDLYVCIGSDSTIKELKGKYPVNNENERKFIIQSIKYVKKCLVGSGSGFLDFKRELKTVKPNFFVVNQDGDSSVKSTFIKGFDIEYIVLKRTPFKELPERSSSMLKKEISIPYRIDLSGGWLDQPFINSIYPGPVVTISIEPNHKFNLRSGMATSTRNKAIEIWKTNLPFSNKEQLAKILFCYENSPGNKEITGSQDSIGIIYPGLNKLQYKNGYWPKKIESVLDEKKLAFVENHLYLIPIKPRDSNYNVFKNKKIEKKYIKELAACSENLWRSINEFNSEEFGLSMLNSFKSQTKIFPSMLNSEVTKTIEIIKNKCLGYKLSGSGGGGYLIVVSKYPLTNAIKIKIRRNNII